MGPEQCCFKKALLFKFMGYCKHKLKRIKVKILIVTSRWSAILFNQDTTASLFVEYIYTEYLTLWVQPRALEHN